jgi:hypothetical protein
VFRRWWQPSWFLLIISQKNLLRKTTNLKIDSAASLGSYDKLTRDMIYLLTAIGLTPGGSNAIHIYTQIIHRITQ